LLDINYPDYDALALKTRNLTELVKYYTTVQREDSLQRIAGMNEKERLAFIDKLINDIKEEKRRAQESERQQHVSSMMFEQNKNRFNTGNSGGQWYFYNPSTVQLGKTQFKMKWGTRNLEDHWRRKNKSIIEMNPEAGDITENADSTQKRITDTETREYYIQDLPLTDSLMLASHERIKDALYKLAQAYKEMLKDYPKAIEAYNNLNSRYPENEYLLASYYDMYQIYKIQNNSTKADYYKNLIITQFPDSKYARMLSNPDYLKNLEANKQKAIELYKETYNAYKLKNFEQVIANSSLADTAYTGDDLIPKFLYLSAMSKGETGDIETMIKDLRYVIKEYPENEVKEPAANILAYLTMGKKSDEEIREEAAKDSAFTAEAEKLYEFIENTPYIYCVVVENKKTDINRLKFDIANYNIDYYSMIDFDIEAQLLNDALQIITVKSFDSSTQGINYYHSIISNNKVFTSMKETDYRHFIISNANFKILFKDQDVGKYMKFFEKNYLSDHE
ncbi:MAG: tetratricopeptide repeat protein, partial [Bacteroidetes bacterium]|nr:tetratricopeptide repeat protein [Bacteroidota bacterium]